VLAKLQAALARHYPHDAAYDAVEVEVEVEAVPDDQKQKETPTEPEPPSIDPPAPTEPLAVVSAPEPEPPSIDPPAPPDGVVADVAPAEQSAATQSGEPVPGVDSVATDASSLRHEALLSAAVEQQSAHERAGKRRSQHEARASCQIKRRSARYSCSVQRRKAAKKEDEAERYHQNIRLDNLAAKFTQWQSKVRACKRTAVELSHSPKPEAGPGAQPQPQLKPKPQPQSPVAAAAASAPRAQRQGADENGGEDGDQLQPALGRLSSEARRRLTMGEKGNGGAEDQLPRPQVPSPASPRAKKSEATTTTTTTAASLEEAEERSLDEASGEPAEMEMKVVVKAEVVVKERRKDMEWKEGNIARKPSREMPAIVVVGDETTPPATSGAEQPQPSLEQAADQSAERGSISETSDSRTSVSYGDYDDEGSSLRTEESEDDDSDIFEMEEVESPRTELTSPESCAALSSSSSSWLSPSVPLSLSTPSASAAAEDDERLRRKLREIEERRQRVHELVKKREKAASTERLGVAAGGASPARQGKRIKRRSQSAEDLAQRREREQTEKEQRALRRAEERAREMLERQRLLQQLAGQTKSTTHHDNDDGENENENENENDENDHGSEDESENNVKKTNKKGEKTKTTPQEEEKDEDEDEEAVPQRRFGHRKQLSFGIGFGPSSLERVHSWTVRCPSHSSPSHTRAQTHYPRFMFGAYKKTEGEPGWVAPREPAQHARAGALPRPTTQRARVMTCPTPQPTVGPKSARPRQKTATQAISILGSLGHKR
jgi:hypothetical protein